LLLKGEFRPGERLSELALVERLAVSRTPIRLAFDRLAHEGLVAPNPSGGFVVCEFTVGDIWDAIEMRGVLEGTAARLAAEGFSDTTQLVKIRAFQAQMDALVASVNNGIETFAVYMNLNEDFHASLTIGQEQHHALLEALEKRQGTRAEAIAS
jgi:GntR family transcriptional regulator of vanillate catabolism